jgi:hypothetical protein
MKNRASFGNGERETEIWLALGGAVCTGDGGEVSPHFPVLFGSVQVWLLQLLESPTVRPALSNKLADSTGSRTSSSVSIDVRTH